MEREDMTTATLTHRIPKESLTVKPVITFKEAVRKVNELVESGDFIQDACQKVYAANTVKALKESLGNYKGPQAFRNAIYGYSQRLRKRAKELREAKKQGGAKAEESPHSFRAHDRLHSPGRPQSLLAFCKGNHGYAAFGI